MKRRLKRAVTLATSATSQPHDRRSTDLLRNAMVAPIEVADPLEFGAKLLVMRSLRDDPLGAMHAAGQVDDVQYQAGRRWQRAFEAAQGSGLKAIDPAKEAVDGGQIARSTLTEYQIQGSSDVSMAMKALGQEGESIVMDILGRGLTLTQAGAKRSYVSERERRYLGQRFRECLTTLSSVFGLSNAKLSPMAGENKLTTLVQPCYEKNHG